MKRINIKNTFRLLVLANGLISSIITIQIINNILYKTEFSSVTLSIILSYGLIWFFSLYRLYNFSKKGLTLYIVLVCVGYIFNILSNFNEFNRFFYILTLTEHLIIGSIITFSLFTKIKSLFK